MGRARGPTNAQKRQAVIEAATALVADRGRQVSLAAICSRAGVSRQTVYNHYGDKAGLLAALTARGLAPCPSIPDEPSGPPEQVLADYAARLLQWACAPEQLTALRARCRGLDMNLPAGLRPGAAAVRRLAEYVASEDQLEVDDPVGSAALFFDLVLAGPQLRTILDPMDPPSPEALEARARRCARLFLRGCATPQRPAPPLPHRPVPFAPTRHPAASPAP